MRHFLAVISLICAVLLPSISLAETAHPPQISNIIIFGDSYSDIGNFPESPKILSKPNESKTLGHLNGMVYVPVSNPVNISKESQLFVISHYPLPDLKSDQLPKQPPLNNKARLYRSLSWTEFLTTDLYRDHDINSGNIMPWITLAINKNAVASTNMSVNYAFASATSRLGCTYYGRFDHVDTKLCNTEGIVQARQRYLQHPTNENLSHIIVPGMLSQIELFEQNVKHHQVNINNKTIYIIEIGGNDMLAAINHFHFPSTKKMADHVYEGAYRLLNKYNAQHVYINTLFDPDITPFARQHKILGLLGQSFAKSYNLHLVQIVRMLNTLYPGRVKLINEFQDLQNMASTTKKFHPEYYRKACQLDMQQNYNISNSSSLNCQFYEFWNALHPSFHTQALFGYEAEQSILQNWN